MTLLLGDNIISALGFTTEENYRNVKQGVCGLRPFAGRYGLPEPFMASEIDDARLDDAFRNVSSGQTSVNYTKLEKASIVSVAEALKGTGINPSDGTVLFILSTTKGNVFLLDENRQAGYEREQLYLWRSAELIARFFGNGNRPAVVSNACISGAAALVAAQRELRSGRYECVIVTGADVLSEFIITGFQSFKALSQEVCKPFDANRTGLNIGEAAATVILTECGSLPGSPSGGFPAVHRTPSRQCVSHLPGSASHTFPAVRLTPSRQCDAQQKAAAYYPATPSRAPYKRGDVVFTAGAVRNDANHISGPSRTGEGAYRALQKVMESIAPEEIAFICAHGTATPYNDEMESVALTRAGLQHVPVNSLKGYFGHTLGAAGVMESIISARALKDETILKTFGFETPGVTNPLDIVAENRTTAKRRCIKMLSGFGGCNVAALFTKLS